MAIALKRQGVLDSLITDAWVPPGHVFGFSRRLRDRYEPELADANVYSWTGRAAADELVFKATGWSSWELMERRNRQFQRRAIDILKNSADRLPRNAKHINIVFAYSYAALDIFRWAKNNGWITVLGQIDPGPRQSKITTEVHRKTTSADWGISIPPESYWARWREECELADVVAANSRWSVECLSDAGIAQRKLKVLPLTGRWQEQATPKIYPTEFSSARPLRVLFVGQLSPVKGLVELLEAARLLVGTPIEFIIVGPTVRSTPKSLRDTANVRFVGAVPRSDVAQWYRKADVFLFPTHSDGFGLTQLEASSCALPIVASRFCGDVVETGVNGLLLPDVSANAIVSAITVCLHRPADLTKWSLGATKVADRFSLKRLGTELIRIVPRYEHSC
jgi:glycosyltransferase involved in cell wall biosynthesis